MKVFAKCLLLSVCVAAVFTVTALAQDRPRIVKQTGSQPVNAPATAPVEKIKTTGSSRPVLTNEIKVVRSADPAFDPPLVQKTASVAPTSVQGMAAAGKTAYGRETSVKLDAAIKSRYGTPYLYGTTGPRTYDCSGFVWSAFQEAGIPFTRASVRTLWAQSEPVEGDDRFKFGTLVFLNGLGHMGIVADENGFYHASSSKGIMYSPFKGYWSSRIVGFRRLKPETPKAAK
ncbi:MAG: C40 family peptidase [Acidobacteria bacterium]|nr:C40 family peptidase [Acidobacteriota bacterium]